LGFCFSFYSLSQGCFSFEFKNMASYFVIEDPMMGQMGGSGRLLMARSPGIPQRGQVLSPTMGLMGMEVCEEPSSQEKKPFSRTNHMWWSEMEKTWLETKDLLEIMG
jgi:hypothetical protein